MTYSAEIAKRRTFGIISHPDAGKTTLTEKLLLYGGAIQIAGAVKSNKIKKSATSDFMEIEKQRGISVATSVMTFEYQNRLINILDTPGHKDFAEDTYRTLTAVDSVIMVIDCVKGVETQTERLMEVCRMRDTPVITFINKLDREGQDPFDLLDEIEKKLNINVRPMSWPIGMGARFKGVYLAYNKSLNLFRAGSQRVEDEFLEITDLNDPQLIHEIGVKDRDTLAEELNIVDTIYDPFNVDLYRAGKLSPVFFGSALNNFGVRELLDTFIDISPSPKGRPSDKRIIDPDEKKFTGFIFKIHANIDPKHRDRIAFLRICSGQFERNKFYYHTRLQKNMRFNNPTTFMASTKTVIDEAYPGDVVGLYDAGNFKIGDTLTEGEVLQFQGIPSFSPEIFKELQNMDPMKSKQLEKGIDQLTDEGVAQLFIQNLGQKKIVGTVGELQFDVIQHRLEFEYGAKCRFIPVNFYKALWLTSDDDAMLKDFLYRKAPYIVYDKDQNPVFLAQSEWILNQAKSDFLKIVFHENSEFKTAE